MMFLFDWVSSMLHAFGFVNKTAKVVFVGLDNAGKTTLLHMLKDDRMGAHNPTWFPTAEEMNIGGVTFTAWDLGGHLQARHVWKSYFPAIQAIVYVVDASDPTRFEESRTVLNEMLANEDIKDVPIAILGNKIDVPGAASDAELKAAFLLDGQTTGKHGISGASGIENERRPLEVFMCSFLKKTGYGDGFRWIAKLI